MDDNNFQQIVIELIREVKDEIKESRQELIQFKQEVNKRFEEVNRRFGEIHQDQREDRKMLMDIWKSRDKVTAQVTWDFIWKATAFNAVMLAFMLFVIKFVA